MFCAFKKKSKDNSMTSPTNIGTAENMSSSAGSMALTPQPATLVATASPSTPSVAFPAEHLESTDGRFGIQTISNPADADMDIWFVHGLTGNRESTWTHPNGTFVPDLMRTRFPTAKIITYGYDANIIGLWENASAEGLRGHGKALAYAISNSRPNDVKRPIFFISHSLGGLVTEQALLLSLEPNEPRLTSVAACTGGIIFIGTPHAGAYLATWGYTLARLIGRFWTTNKATLSVLKQKSEVLKGVEEVFQRQLTADGSLNHVKIFCFYETVPVDVVGFVVPEESATILPYPNCGIDANHMNMTKFTSLNDAGFISIRGVLADWIQRGMQQLIRETNAPSNRATSAPTSTFHNGPINARLVQQGNGNAGRDVNHGNVTNQSAGRDWINKDLKMHGKERVRAARRENNLSDDDVV